MSDNLTTQCDCPAFGTDDQQAHQLGCALWENELFAKGYADWEPNLGELVIVHPIHQSLHTATEDEIGGQIGDAVQEVVPSLLELAALDFEDRCTAIELELWTAFEKDLVDWPISNYTIDGISRVFNQEHGEWENAKLQCHCTPQAEKHCVHCGVLREGKEGTYWGTMWRPQIIRTDDILCRCPGQQKSQWNCIKCGVKRLPTEPKSGVEPLARPMVKWDPEMAKKKVKTGGATAWSGWNPNKGKATTTYVQCRHKGRELEFPNGKKIYGSSASAKAPAGYNPVFGIYLDSTWFHNATNLGIMLPWQDMGLPKLDRDAVETALDLACKMIDKGDVIEVGCIGGHGRTGTFLALVAMRNGVDDPEEAITYIREHYCKEAIESATQEWYIKAWHAEEHGLPVPEKPVMKSFTSTTHGTGSWHANEKVKTEKRCDSNMVWYCPECNADQDDAADSCYWCLASFENTGVQPLTEWSHTVDPTKLADIALRLKDPKIVKKRNEPPKTAPKAVTAGASTTDDDDPTGSQLPFGLPVGGSEDWSGFY